MTSITTESRNRTTVCRSEFIAQVYSRLYAPLCGYVAKRIGNKSDVEDIVQDTFESLLKPGLMISEQSVSKFVYSIAHNLSINYLRRHACSVKAREYFFAHAPVMSCMSDAKVAVSDVVRIEQEALSKVGDKGKDIYMMYVHRGSSVREIAEGLNLSERTVENHIFRTRNKVRETLKKAL